MNLTQILSDDWFTFLRQLFPVSGLIHVGAGVGSAVPVYREWGIPNALLVEADPALQSRLASKIEGQEGWASLQAIVADKPAAVTFYQSNNPHEHGLIEPEKLAPFWRNLRTVESQTADSQTLANILLEKNIGASASPYNWLVVDCLPAAAILEGLGEHIGQMDVIIARAILDGNNHFHWADKTAIETYLNQHDFNLAHIYEERHPSVGQVLYVRNYKAGSHRHQANIARLERIKVETGQQLAALQQAKAEADKANSELQAQIQHITQERDQLASLVNERQQQINTLQNAKAETDQQLAASQQAKADLENTSAQLQLQLTEMQESKQQLETSHAETVYQCNLLQDEFAKAETQVDLIKELLRRELKGE